MEREFNRFRCALCLKHKRATQVEVHGDGWICCYKCRSWFEVER
jgi:hypothetical protein